MDKNLFFSGPVRIGKSTCLRNNLRNKEVPVYGFTVQRIMREGQILGYQASCMQDNIVPPVDITYSENLEGVFLGEGKKDRNVLNQVIHTVLDIVKEKTEGIILLDEIGGFELISDSFMQSLKELLKSPLPCIGIIKMKENLMKAIPEPGLIDVYVKKYWELAEAIQCDGTIYRSEFDQITEIERLVRNFLTGHFTDSIIT